MRGGGCGDARGFTLIEALIATAIVMLVAGLVSALAVDTQAMWRVETERVDLQQRTRVAADVIRRALLGSGDAAHASVGGAPSIFAVPPVVPRRIGRRSPDSVATVRDDLFTIIRRVPDTEQTTLAVALGVGGASIRVAPCEVPDCGMAPGTTVLVADSSGRYDLFTVLSSSGPDVGVRHLGAAHLGYPAGALVTVVALEIYYVDRAERILRRSDGDLVDAPVVDEVVGLEVAYYASVLPPIRARPEAGVESCLFAADGAYRAPAFPVLAGTGGSFVPLRRERLQDGPWCGAGANAFDADLLRLQRVRVRVRLQAGDESMRGADRTRFRNPGFAARSSMEVPDTNAVVDVELRNSRSGW